MEMSAQLAQTWVDSSQSHRHPSAHLPGSITVTARQVPGWGFWHGSQITDSPPPRAGCGAATSIELVPFGGTNIRISVFPWLASK